VDEVTKISLGKELGRLITQEEELAKSYILKEKELAGAKTLVEAYIASPETGNPAHPQEVK
jgi:hypothetical protein